MPMCPHRPHRCVCLRVCVCASVCECFCSKGAFVVCHRLGWALSKAPLPLETMRQRSHHPPPPHIQLTGCSCLSWLWASGARWPLSRKHAVGPRLVGPSHSDPSKSFADTQRVWWNILGVGWLPAPSGDRPPPWEAVMSPVSGRSPDPLHVGRRLNDSV